MKKIMFNDRYGLTQAVLERKKTMTRRIVNYPKKFKGVEDTMLEFNRRIGADIYYDCVVCDADGHELGQLPLPFEVGDVVAITQAYKNDDVLNYNAYNKDGTAREDGLQRHKEMLGSKGYRNKMFVKADLMPHHIRITDLWFERLQDISDDDCLKEGIHVHNPEPGNPNFIGYAYDATPGTNVKRWWFHTPREAFAALINRVSGPHTWDGNPWVIAYTFELVD
jgi:hypothetical protein